MFPSFNKRTATDKTRLLGACKKNEEWALSGDLSGVYQGWLHQWLLASSRATRGLFDDYRKFLVSLFKS